MSKTLNLQNWDINDIRHQVNKDYRNGESNLIYTDASYKVENKSIGIGVHMRLKNGKRLSYFSGNVSNSEQDFERIYYEDIALCLGLKLCIQNLVKQPVVYIDSKAVYGRYNRIINTPKDTPLHYTDISSSMMFAHIKPVEKLWSEIRELYYQLKIRRLYLIPSHAGLFGNEEADRMATKGRIEAKNAHMQQNTIAIAN